MAGFQELSNLFLTLAISRVGLIGLVGSYRFNISHPVVLLIWTVNRGGRYKSTPLLQKRSLFSTVLVDAIIFILFLCRLFKDCWFFFLAGSQYIFTWYWISTVARILSHCMHRISKTLRDLYHATAHSATWRFAPGHFTSIAVADGIGAMVHFV